MFRCKFLFEFATDKLNFQTCNHISLKKIVLSIFSNEIFEKFYLTCGLEEALDEDSRFITFGFIYLAFERLEFARNINFYKSGNSLLDLATAVELLRDEINLLEGRDDESGTIKRSSTRATYNVVFTSVS